jgi:murein DD-endopeptidase MepM/ murein hydrolase activator NlpD
VAPGARYYTLLFIPDDERRTISLKVRAGLVRTLAGLLVLFGVGSLVLMIRAGSIALQLQLLPQLRAENKRLKADNERLEDIRTRLARIEELDTYLQQLAVLERSPDMRLPVAGVEPRLASAILDTQNTVSASSTTPSVALSDSSKLHYAQQIRQATPYITPVRGWVTRPFTEDRAKGAKAHKAIDFAASEGTPIHATAPGIVESLVSDPFLGKLVTVRHMSGFVTRYGHCAQVLVVEGQHVERGQTIATVGNTGVSSAPHLHYEVLKDGKQVDPMRYIVN